MNESNKRRLGLALLALGASGAMPSSAFATEPPACPNKKWEGRSWKDAVSGKVVPCELGAGYTKTISHPGYYGGFQCVKYDGWQCEDMVWNPETFRIVRSDGSLYDSGRTTTEGHSMSGNSHKCPEGNSQ